MTGESLDIRAYQAAFHITSEAAAFVDESGVVVAANPAFTQLFGGLDLGPRPFEELFMPEERDRVAGLMREAHRWFESALTGVRSAEGRAPVDLWADQYVTGTGEHLLLLRARSASARMEAERLHEAAAFAAHAANKADTEEDLFGGMWDVLRRVLPQATGAAWLRRADPGWRVAESRGDLTEWGERGWMPPDSLWHSVAKEREAIMIADAALELQGENPLRDAKPPVGSLILSPIMISDAAEGLVVVAASDPGSFSLEDLRCLAAATREMGSALARMRAHEALARAHGELQVSVAQKDALLERVGRLNDELAEFALWTTHDLREPLRGLAELAEILAQEAAGGRAHEVQELAEQLNASATHLKEGIRALHDFHVAARDSDVREPAVLESLVRSAAAEAGLPDVHLEVKGDLRVLVDPWRVTRAIRDMFRFVLDSSSRPQPGPQGFLVEVARSGDGAARVSMVIPTAMSPHRAEAAFRLLGQRGSLALARRIALQHAGALRFESGAEPRISLVLPTVADAPADA